MKRSRSSGTCALLACVLAAVLLVGCSAATPTPVPLPTRTPMASPTPAPTQIPTVTLIPVDPHVEISASTTTLRIGDVVTVVGEAVDIGMPYFTLYFKDSGAGDFAPMVRHEWEGRVYDFENRSQVLELVSAEGRDAVRFEMRGLGPGSIEMHIQATGEIHYGYPGPAMWGGGGSKTIQITVTEP